MTFLKFEEYFTMSTIVLEAQARALIGKGASRRLRRLEDKVPAVVYGGKKAAISIHLAHNKVIKALEQESIFSSVLNLNIDGKVEQVILKDLQRHPYRPVILHMDLQRVSAKDVLVKMVPLHFINEESSPGVVEGGVVNHTMNQIEIKCQVKDLPEYIEINLASLELNQVVHLSEVQLPKGVELAHELDSSHDHQVVSVHLPRVIEEPEEVLAEEGEALEGEEASEAAEQASEEDASKE